MIDKNTFMETLHSVQEIAKSSPEPLAKEEIQEYFKDIELTAEQEDLVYQFLLQPVEETEEEAPEQEHEKEERVKRGAKSQRSAMETSAHFQMYLDEVKELKTAGAQEMMHWYDKLVQGDACAIEAISNEWLSRVIKIAGEYEGSHVMKDDLVQEGNIGLLRGLNELLGTWERGHGEEISNDKERWLGELELTLGQAIRRSMEDWLLESAGAGEQEKSILAKASLVHEARRLLSKDQGGEPSLQELAEYTKLSEEEIWDILSLVKEK